MEDGEPSAAGRPSGWTCSGPLRLVVDGAPVEVRGPKRRAVLALLALAGGRAVTADQLVDALWPSAPPESGRAALHSHVSRLRGHLGPGAARLVTVDGGYRLVLGADGLDVARARALLTDARATAKRDPGGGVARCCARRWRSGAARRSPTCPRSHRWPPAAVGFEQLRREVTDLLIGCAIDAGQVDGVVELAADALAADPLREPAVLLLMRALAMTGQAPRGAADRRATTGAGSRRRPDWIRRLRWPSSNEASPSGTIGPPSAARTPDRSDGPSGDQGRWPGRPG